MEIVKVPKNKAVYGDWGKMTSFNWKLPSVRSGTSVVVAEFAGPHGKVKTKKDRERIYYILEGKGEFESEGKTLPVSEGDVIAIPPQPGTITDQRRGN